MPRRCMRTRCRRTSRSTSSSSWPAAGSVRRTAQQNYISANYTHAFNYLLSRGVNVVAQLVAKRVVDGAPRYSLSCNTDITVDLLKVRRAGGDELQDVRAGQFRAAVHAGRRRSRRRRVRRHSGKPGRRISAVRAAGGADLRPEVCDRPACGGPGARRRHAADRHRPDRRCAGAVADRAASRQCQIPGSREAARERRRRPASRPHRSTRASTASARCSSSRS